MTEHTTVTEAILESPNKVHYVWEKYDSTVCGLDWSNRTYTTDVSEGVIKTIGYCKSCKRDLEESGDTEPSTTAEFRAEVADQLTDVSPRPESPEILRKQEWKAIYQAIVDE